MLTDCSPPTLLNQWERALSQDEGIQIGRHNACQDISPLHLNKAPKVIRALQYLLWVLRVWGGPLCICLYPFLSALTSICRGSWSEKDSLYNFTLLILTSMCYADATTDFADTTTKTTTNTNNNLKTLITLSIQDFRKLQHQVLFIIISFFYHYFPLYAHSLQKIEEIKLILFYLIIM